MCAPSPSAYSSMRSSSSGVGACPRSSSCTTGSRVRSASRRRTGASKDISATRAHGWSSPCRASSRSSGTSSGSPTASWWAACLSSSATPTGRPRPDRLRADHRQHLGERRHALRAVVRRVAGPGAGHPLARGERLQLGQREVLDEPAVLLDPVDDQRAAQVGEPRTVGDVGRRAELEVVARHEHPVARGDEVELDVVDAHPDGGPVGVEGVLGTVPAGAAVRNHGGGGDQRRGPVHRLAGHRHGTTLPEHGDRTVVPR